MSQVKLYIVVLPSNNLHATLNHVYFQVDAGSNKLTQKEHKYASPCFTNTPDFALG